MIWLVAYSFYFQRFERLTFILYAGTQVAVLGAYVAGIVLQSPATAYKAGTSLACLTKNPTVKSRKAVHISAFGIHGRVYITVQGNLHIGMPQHFA